MAYPRVEARAEATASRGGQVADAARRILSAWVVGIGVIGWTAGALRAEGDDRDVVLRALDRGDTKKAIALLEPVVKKQHASSMSWFDLGRAYHMDGRYEDALRANREALHDPLVRAPAHYNMACSYARMERVDDAVSSLDRAIGAGFLDFDSIASDPDLASLREAGRLPAPERHEYERFRARNGVELRYLVVAPKDADPKRRYPGVVFFPPGSGGRASADWMIEKLWGAGADGHGCVLVCVLAPERGYFTHPFHHAFEELLTRLRAEHPVKKDAYHLVGVSAGNGAAGTYAGMSGRYFASYTSVSNLGWGSWDEARLVRRFQGASIPVHLIVAEKDEEAARQARHVREVLERAGGVASLTQIDGAEHAMHGLENGVWLERVLSLARSMGT